MTLLDQKLDELSKLEDECVALILSDTNLDKFSKLQLIEKLKLWEYDSFINNIFTVWEDEASDEEKRLAIADGKIPGKDYFCRISDCTLLYNYDKYQIVSYIDILHNMMQDLEEEDSMFIVAQCRGDYHATIYKTPQEIIDYIYDYAVEHKSIGFTFDW